MTNKNAEPLLPVELGAGKVKFAQGIKAGRWVFATGVMAQDFKNGIAPDVLSERAPHAGLPKREKEALRIWENIDAVLRAAGTDRTNLVRTDQYYTTVKAVPAYQQVRREFLAGRVAPSTSITQQGLLLPGADMNIQALGVIPAPGFEVTHLKHAASRRPADLGLFAGADRRRLHLRSRRHSDRDRRRAASQRRCRGGVDGRRPQWAGQPIKLETEFIITQRHGAVARAGRRHHRRRHPCPGLSDRPGGLFGLQRNLVPALRENAADARRSSPASSTGSRPTTARSRSTCWRRSPAAPRRSATSTPAFRPHFVTSRRR